ncbi:hypothetical protein TOPH_02515 [Tolypocladium ophioglossoides CBS 100239]|uniref:RNA-binding protein n=1 Tax=Tolypocladium ophioglossoides (strain CBS 100239) TaxID=1163406 RepID=A0A0L0NGD0_TOLOC|nr:hypothetical protein TOPH_02515 [Tolypocladium ophioglossoides CBS 100239]
MAPAASDFQKIITDARERKKNEALADRVFSRDRRQSAPSKLKPTPGGSLASRVGIRKACRLRAPQEEGWLHTSDPCFSLQQPQQQRVSSVTTRRASVPSGNVNGEWTHDLHDSLNAHPPPLSSRITLPGANNQKTAATQRRSRLASAMDRMDVDQVNIVSSAARAGGSGSSGKGISIRGLAGPFVVMGQNFAPGTTAADIESAMTPIGGEMVSCKIVKTTPFLIAEMVFASREGGEQVIDTFNDKTASPTFLVLSLYADGRLLKVYPKVGGYQPSTSTNLPPANAPNGPRATRNTTRDQVIDGSMGFSGDLMDADNNSSNSSSRPLYSDKIVAGNRRGRGFQRGRAFGR